MAIKTLRCRGSAARFNIDGNVDKLRGDDRHVDGVSAVADVTMVTSTLRMAVLEVVDREADGKATVDE